MLTLIENATVFAPAPLGVVSILLANDRIERIGPIDADAVRRLFPDTDVVNAAGLTAIPGLIDPHEHLIGAGGEEGFASRLPPVTRDELVRAGITTVVGVIGTDTVTRQLSALLGQVKELSSSGLTALMYTGGFSYPTPTLTGTVAGDLVLLSEVIGVGEIAMNDVRSWEPSVDEIVRLVSETSVAGMIAGKAGVVHFHLGAGRYGLEALLRVVEQRDVQPECIYPTHVNRNPELLKQAANLARRGAFVDMDVVEGDLPRWLRLYRELGGPADRLTVSSDAHTPDGSPDKLREELAAVVRSGVPLQRVLPHVTTNPATALKLKQKGRLEAGMDADLALVDPGSLQPVHLFGRGRRLLRDGTPERA